MADRPDVEGALEAAAPPGDHDRLGPGLALLDAEPVDHDRGRRGCEHHPVAVDPPELEHAALDVGPHRPALVTAVEEDAPHIGAGRLEWAERRVRDTDGLEEAAGGRLRIGPRPRPVRWDETVDGEHHRDRPVAAGPRWWSSMVVVVVPVVGTVPVVGPAQSSSARRSMSSSKDCPGAGIVVSGTAVSGAFAGTMVVVEPPAAAESVGAVEVVGMEAVDGSDGGGRGARWQRGRRLARRRRGRRGPAVAHGDRGGVVAAGGDADRHADDERRRRAEGSGAHEAAPPSRGHSVTDDGERCVVVGVHGAPVGGHRVLHPAARVVVDAGVVVHACSSSCTASAARPRCTWVLTEPSGHAHRLRDLGLAQLAVELQAQRLALAGRERAQRGDDPAVLVRGQRRHVRASPVHHPQVSGCVAVDDLAVAQRRAGPVQDRAAQVRRRS